MTEIINIGRLLKTDKDGYIISESDITKLKSPWKEAVEEIKEEYIKHLGDAVHSIYVRGTVSRGEAIEGVSDIDTFAILNRPMTDADTAWFNEVQKRLEAKYSFAENIGFVLKELERVMEEKAGVEYKFRIKTQSFCIYGEDLALIIEPFKADKGIARRFGQNIKNCIAKVVLKVDRDVTPDNVKWWCDWIMKLLVRRGFILVMDKEKSFTRDLYPCYESFIKYYPEKKEEMWKALNWAINPTGNSEELTLFINDFGIWLANETEKELS